MARIPRMSYADIVRESLRFLQTYHRTFTIPVPIELIVERDFGLDIVPVPGLRRSLDIESGLSHDLKTIFVDEHCMVNLENRYRFSLAHELAHLLFHKELIEGLSFSNLQEWKSALLNLPDDGYEWLEYQAYVFAGLVLVPEDPLRQRFEDAANKAYAAGIDIYEVDTLQRKFVHESLARQFSVSAAVIEKRTRKDGLWN